MGVEGPGRGLQYVKRGCAMTSVAMALTQRGFTLENGDVPTPKSLNRYLVENQGYHCDSGDCNNLVLSKPDDITKGFFHSTLERNHSNTINHSNKLQNGAERAAEATTRNLHWKRCERYL